MARYGLCCHHSHLPEAVAVVPPTCGASTVLRAVNQGISHPTRDASSDGSRKSRLGLAHGVASDGRRQLPGSTRHCGPGRQPLYAALAPADRDIRDAANVHDKHPLPDLLHGQEQRVYGDCPYASQSKLIPTPGHLGLWT